MPLTSYVDPQAVCFEQNDPPRGQELSKSAHGLKRHNRLTESARSRPSRVHPAVSSWWGSRVHTARKRALAV